MFIQVLLNYIFGYLSIYVEGFFLERFINTCISKKILLWNLKREKSSVLYTNISIKDFKRIKEVARKSNCRVRIKEKKGLPFLVRKYKKRKIFIFLILPIVLAIIISSNYIWNIEINGIETIKKQELLETLKEEGIEIGKLKTKLNAKTIINNIRLKRDDISWMSIDLKGTNAVINIVEAEAKPDVIDKTKYCNIVAKKSGIISKITANSGTLIAKEEDFVDVGDILIAGYMEGKYTDRRYVHASGNVIAKVWYTKKEKINLNSKEYTETGKTENRYSIKFNNFTINLYKTLPNFEKYDTIDTAKKLKIFSNFYLPIEINKVTFVEKRESLKTYGKAEAINLLTQKIEQEFKEENVDKLEKNNKIINVYELNKDEMEVEITYEVLEQIGEEKEIEI